MRIRHPYHAESCDVEEDDLVGGQANLDDRDPTSAADTDAFNVDGYLQARRLNARHRAPARGEVGGHSGSSGGGRGGGSGGHLAPREYPADITVIFHRTPQHD